MDHQKEGKDANVDAELISSGTNPLNINEILKQVVKDAGSELIDLLSMREVNRAWNSYAVTILDKKNYVLNLKGYQAIKDYVEFRSATTLNSREVSTLEYLSINLSPSPPPLVWDPAKNLVCNKEDSSCTDLAKQILDNGTARVCCIKWFDGTRKGFTRSAHHEKFWEVVNLASAQLQTLLFLPTPLLRRREEIVNLGLPLTQSGLVTFPQLSHIYIDMRSANYSASYIGYLLHLIDVSPTLKVLRLFDSDYKWPLLLWPKRFSENVEQLINGLSTTTKEGLAELCVPVFSHRVLVALRSQQFKQLKKLKIYKKMSIEEFFDEFVFYTLLTNLCPILESFELHFFDEMVLEINGDGEFEDVVEHNENDGFAAIYLMPVLRERTVTHLGLFAYDSPLNLYRAKKVDTIISNMHLALGRNLSLSTMTLSFNALKSLSSVYLNPAELCRQTLHDDISFPTVITLFIRSEISAITAAFATGDTRRDQTLSGAMLGRLFPSLRKLVIDEVVIGTGVAEKRVGGVEEMFHAELISDGDLTYAQINFSFLKTWVDQVLLNARDHFVGYSRLHSVRLASSAKNYEKYTALPLTPLLFLEKFPTLKLFEMSRNFFQVWISKHEQQVIGNNEESSRRAVEGTTNLVGLRERFPNCEIRII